MKPLPSIAITLVLTLTACDEDLPSIDADSVTAASVAEHIQTLPPPPMQDPNKVELGRLLFWDPILSAENDVACASCHHPDSDYTDGLFASLGVGAQGLGHQRTGNQRTPRNAQTILNTVYNGLTTDEQPTQSEAPMFWDNRVVSLEAQAREPIHSAIEMRGEVITETEIMPLVLSRLAAIEEYQQLFSTAYPDGITESNMLDSIASFERNLVANNSAFDRFMRGDRKAMSDLQIIGMQRFIDVGCSECHGGPMFSDYQLHVLGAADHAQNPNGIDSGANGDFSFRTPSLRNLPRTGPYLHGGTEDSLASVIRFYEDVSAGKSRNSQVSGSLIDPLGRAVDGEVDEAVPELSAFLEALDDPDFDKTIPDTVPSGLPVGGGEVIP